MLEKKEYSYKTYRTFCFNDHQFSFDFFLNKVGTSRPKMREAQFHAHNLNPNPIFHKTYQEVVKKYAKREKMNSVKCM